jgi:hypothetical protein
LEDRSVDEKMGLLWILGKLGGGEWIHLAQDWDQWWSVINELKNLGVLPPRS